MVKHETPGRPCHVTDIELNIEIDKTRASVASMVTAYRTRRMATTTDAAAITELAAVTFRQDWNPSQFASILALTVALLSDATKDTDSD